MTSEARRLHRLSWLFLTAKSAKGLILPAIFLLFASAGNPWLRFELLGFLFLVPTLIGALIRQKIYNYRFASGELIVRDGILTKKERHIPFDRIHNISIVQNPLHRLFGVASARIETASGGKPEAVMRVLSLEAVHELRQRAKGLSADPGRATDETESESTSALLSLGPGELLRMGFISGGGAVVIAAAAGLLWQLQWWELDWVEPSRYLQGEVPAWAARLLDPGSWGARSQQAVVAALLILSLMLLMFLMRALSAGWHLVKYHGFVLQRHRSDLRMQFGLLTKVSSLLPMHRIQLITTYASWLHRCFGRLSINLEIAGSSEEGSDLEQELAQSGVKRRQYLAPILRSGLEGDFLAEILPAIDLDAVDWQPLSPRAKGRIMKRWTLTTGLAASLLAILAGLTPIPMHPAQALWLPAIVLPWAFAHTTGWLRYSGWGMTDKAVYFRSGWLNRSVSVVPLDKVQTVSLHATPFDRRRHMASLAVDTAGAGSFGHRIHIPYLDQEVSNRIRQRLYEEASATEFDW